MKLSVIITIVSNLLVANSTHLDDVDGVFTKFSFDNVKVKTQTNC